MSRYTRVSRRNADVAHQARVSFRQAIFLGTASHFEHARHICRLEGFKETVPTHTCTSAANTWRSFEFRKLLAAAQNVILHTHTHLAREIRNASSASSCCDHTSSCARCSLRTRTFESRCECFFCDVYVAGQNKSVHSNSGHVEYSFVRLRFQFRIRSSNDMF